MTVASIYYPINFNSQYVKAHHDLEDDLRKILERSGFKDDFIGKCKQRLMYLEKSQEKC
jgi:hypothetical protein